MTLWLRQARDSLGRGVSTGDDHLTGLLAERLRAGTHTRTGFRTIMESGPLNEGWSATFVRMSLGQSRNLHEGCHHESCDETSSGSRYGICTAWRASECRPLGCRSLCSLPGSAAGPVAGFSGGGGSAQGLECGSEQRLDRRALAGQPAPDRLSERLPDGAVRGLRHPGRRRCARQRLPPGQR